MQQFHMDPPESVAAFIRGDVEAIFAWEPNVTRAVKAGGKVLASGSRSNVPGQEGPHRMAPGHGAFSVNVEFAQKHPQTVRAVLRALVAGNAYLQTPDSIPAVARWMNKQTNMAVEMIEVTMRATRYTMALDRELVEDMGVTQQFMLDKKQIGRKLAPRDLYVVEPLRDVDPKLVTLTLE
jgi:NitT/TauT family transport system substrate-binding protein